MTLVCFLLAEVFHNQFNLLRCSYWDISKACANMHDRLIFPRIRWPLDAKGVSIILYLKGFGVENGRKIFHVAVIRVHNLRNSVLGEEIIKNSSGLESSRVSSSWFMSLHRWDYPS